MGRPLKTKSSSNFIFVSTSLFAEAQQFKMALIVSPGFVLSNTRNKEIINASTDSYVSSLFCATLNALLY